MYRRSEYEHYKPQPLQDYYLKQTENYTNSHGSYANNHEDYNYYRGNYNDNRENRNANSENRDYYNSPVKRSTYEVIDDEEEDELYFYGGGRNKKTTIVKDAEEEYVHVPEATQDDFEYDAADFESEASSSSSWTSESEADFEVDVVKKRKKKTVVVSTLKVKSNVVVSAARPKAYAPKIVDLDAPTIIKLPPNPLPDTWAHIVQNPLKRIKDKCTEIITPSIQGKGWLEGLKLVNPVQGILMRPPFHPDTFTIKHWAKFMQNILPAVMNDGYLFVWVEREELAGVIRAAEKYLSFKYVENLCWIRRDLGNRLLREFPTAEPALFYKSKMTLLILRRDPQNQCKLRHQRNPDCIFDFAGPGRMPDGRVYDVIEMLLDGGKFCGPHLMHLWAGSEETDRLVYGTRKQWIRVLEVAADAVDYVAVDAINEDVYDVDAVDAVDTVNNMNDVNAIVDYVDTVKAVDAANYVATIDTVDVVHSVDNMNIVDAVHIVTVDVDSLDHDIPLEDSVDLVTAKPDTSDTADISDLNPINPDINMIPSSTFDEDFCNFITCDPVI